MNALDVAIHESEFEITEVVSGRAAGVDTLGETWAEINKIPIKLFPPDRKRYGWPRAAFRRNEEMGDYADALIALWDGKSHGTKHMIDYATQKGLRVYVHRL
jgi:hypothetical protein